jgi:hypothetical protein
MKTLNLGIELDQGADFSLVIGIFGMGGPIDITGYQFLGEMRDSTDPTSPVVAEFDFEILNQYTNQGQVQWTISQLVLENLELSASGNLQTARLTTPFVFDIKMKDTMGNISRIIQGIAYVSPQATQEDFG